VSGGGSAAPAPSSSPASVAPTSVQQSETQIITIVKNQVVDRTAATALTQAVTNLESTATGSNAYTAALGKLSGLVTSELKQGLITSDTANALRQQTTYLLVFSGS
jgi:hypothetical protein